GLVVVVDDPVRATVVADRVRVIDAGAVEALNAHGGEHRRSPVATIVRVDAAGAAEPYVGLIGAPYGGAAFGCAAVHLDPCAVAGRMQRNCEPIHRRIEIVGRGTEAPERVDLGARAGL